MFRAFSEAPEKRSLDILAQPLETATCQRISAAISKKKKKTASCK
jgi:hypothetical protein